MIEFRCPHCGEGVEVEDRFAGRQGQCPECGRVIGIPSPGAAAAGGASALQAPVIHGPRRLSVPESVLSVDPTALQAAGATGTVAGSGSESIFATPRVALMLAPVPCVSVLGTVFGAISWSRAAKARQAHGRRLAMVATVLGAVWTVAQVGLSIAVFVAAVHIGVVQGQAEECRQSLYYRGGGLISEAMSSSGGAASGTVTLPEKLTTAAHFGYYYGERCPATDQEYGYIGGLTYDSSASTIILYDGKATHGYVTWLKTQPDGRNVYRMNGVVEFLTEEAFQKEMVEQGARLGHPWNGGP